MKVVFSSILLTIQFLFSHACLSQSNIEVTKLYSDSLCSSFEIQVKDSVRLHYHINHTENIFVIEGQARMQIEDDFFEIAPGHHFTIPKGNKHAVWVLSEVPLKVVSIQSPEFKGEDRHFVDE